MAEAIIARRDNRYSGDDTLAIIPEYKKATFETGTNKIAWNTVYYPLGDAATVSTKPGYIIFQLSVSPVNPNDGSTRTGATVRLGYNLTIGTKTYNVNKNVWNDLYCLTLFEAYYVPAGVPISYKIFYENTPIYWQNGTVWYVTTN